jgi:transposase-like protein
MKATRKKHTAAFKTQVAIEAIKEQETLSELSKQFDVHPQMTSNWKREFLSREAEIFSTKAPEQEAAKREQSLYEKIDHLEVEVNFARGPQKNWGY